jgi:hypothetical protein
MVEMSSLDESAEEPAEEPGPASEVHYFLSGTATAPVIYEEGPDTWRSYRPGRVLINQGSGPIPFGFKNALQPIELAAALELLDSTPSDGPARPQQGGLHREQREPVGLGGWLAFQLVLLALGLAGTTVSLSLSISMHQWTITSLSLAAIDFVASVVLLTLAFRKTRVFPRAMIAWLLYGLLVGVGSRIWAMAGDQHDVLGIGLGYGYWASNGANIAFGLAWCGLWVGYFLRSKRVRNTFTRPVRPFREPSSDS